MNKDFVKQQLQNLMEVINEQQHLVLSHQGKIPQIELDILMGNFRKAYELLMELNKQVPAQPPIPAPLQHPGESLQPEELIAKVAAPAAEEKVILPEVTSEISAMEEVTEALANSAAHVTAPMQPEIVIANVDTPVVASNDEVITEAVLPQVALAKERVREFSKPAPKATTTASLFDDAPTIADKFQGAPTLYDKIASVKEDKSLAGKLQKNPVSDLKKSIGINEKFAFINELFDGDLESYNTAIDQLNTCGNYNDAVETLSNALAPKYNWSDDGDCFLQLKNLVERRFSA